MVREGKEGLLTWTRKLGIYFFFSLEKIHGYMSDYRIVYFKYFQLIVNYNSVKLFNKIKGK